MNERLLIPGAIVIAGLLIAGSLFMGDSTGTGNPNENEAGSIRALQEDDYVLGDRDAELVIVEYSDLECPFCKRFHETMKQIVEEYDGQVAWVYRHFPLQSIHPNAPRLALGAECVGELGGNDAFWSFIDGMFEIAPEGEFFPIAELTNLATAQGVDGAAFDTCIEEGRYRDDISADLKEVTDAGGRGTPHSFLIDTRTDERTVIPGAQPYSSVKALIDEKLSQ